jgi:hypothetical protein
VAIVGYNSIADVPSPSSVEVVDVRRYNIPLDVDDLVRRYVAGESEKALAESLDVSRGTVRNRLLKAGVQPRNRSEGMFTRMAQTSPEERARLASAAHAAVRGRPLSTSHKLASAATKEAMGINAPGVSPAEKMLAGWLAEAGLPVISQKAVGPYNVDIASGTVAVEIFGGGWHKTKLEGERLRYILNAGWDVLYIWVHATRFPLTAGAAQYVLAHCQFRDGNPAAPRCYRVIRGGGEFIAEGSADGDDIPDIVPVSNRPYALAGDIRGTCQCGCGVPTRIPDKNNALQDEVRGVPNKFLRGHNMKVRDGNTR